MVSPVRPGAELEQDLQPLLGRKPAVILARGGFGVAIGSEYGNHPLHQLISSSPREKR